MCVCECECMPKWAQRLQIMWRWCNGKFSPFAQIFVREKQKFILATKRKRNVHSTNKINYSFQHCFSFLLFFSPLLWVAQCRMRSFASIKIKFFVLAVVVVRRSRLRSFLLLFLCLEIKVNFYSFSPHLSLFSETNLPSRPTIFLFETNFTAATVFVVPFQVSHSLRFQFIRLPLWLYECEFLSFTISLYLLFGPLFSLFVVLNYLYVHAYALAPRCISVRSVCANAKWSGVWWICNVENKNYFYEKMRNFNLKFSLFCILSVCMDIFASSDASQKKLCSVFTKSGRKKARTPTPPKRILQRVSVCLLFWLPASCSKWKQQR